MANLIFDREFWPRGSMKRTYPDMCPHPYRQGDLLWGLFDRYSKTETQCTGFETHCFVEISVPQEWTWTTSTSRWGALCGTSEFPFSGLPKTIRVWTWRRRQRGRTSTSTEHVWAQQKPGWAVQLCRGGGWELPQTSQTHLRALWLCPGIFVQVGY